MTWSDVTRPPKPRVVRQFAVLCLVIFGALGLFQILARARPILGGACLAFAVLSLVLGMTAPNLFRWVFTGSMLLAFPIGFVVSQVMLAVLFFVVFLAIGLLIRAGGSDPLGRRRKPPGESYWSPKPMPADAGRYLRQY